jgi:hypothetical protein
MFARSDGWVQIGTGLTNANGPACSSAANDTYMAVDSNSAKGRAILAIAQTALLSGRSVTVNGLDTCDGDGAGAGTAPGTVEVMGTFWLKQQ